MTVLDHIVERSEWGWVDSLDGCRISARIHNEGHVTLVDIMPRLIPKGGSVDFAVTQSARVSYGSGTKKSSDDRGLIRYLMRNHHTSPFEMIETKWHVKLPIFVARQWIRHRTASVNELSGRYSVIPKEFWIPDNVRRQSEINKQDSQPTIDQDLLDAFRNFLLDQQRGYLAYENLVENEGLARELGRTGLPLNLYTEWYWKIDLHNLMNFLKLRMASNAQKEIRDYANAMFEIMKGLCPVTMEAFQDYVLDVMTLSGPELRAIEDEDAWGEHLSKNEAEDLLAKWNRLFVPASEEDEE